MMQAPRSMVSTLSRHHHQLRQSIPRTVSPLASSVVTHTSCTQHFSSLQTPMSWKAAPVWRQQGVFAIDGKRCFSQAPSEEPQSQEGGEAQSTETNNTEGATPEEVQAQHIAELTKELEEKTSKFKEMEERLIRTFADMENVRTIARNDVKKANTFAVQKFAKSLLDVADNLSRAISAVEAPDDTSEPQLKILLEGVQMTDVQLAKIFKEFGVQKFGEEGEPFDPQKHDALFIMEDPSKEPNTIGSIIKTGYLLHDRVIRPAQVGTIKGPD